jgi:hypothetical protein
MQRLLAVFSSCGKDKKKELFRQANELLCDPEPKIITNEVRNSCEIPIMERMCVCVGREREREREREAAA